MHSLRKLGLRLCDSMLTDGNGPDPYDFTGDEWPQLAEDLGWSTEEVQLHAYRYLRCLMEADEFPEEDRQ